MNLKRPPLMVTAASRPDLDAAADAMLPMFLAFLAGRLKRQPPEEQPKVKLERADESRAD